MTVRTSTLANGLTVATDAMPQVETAAIGVWVNAGTRNERPEINGIAHLLEHMAFKGTARRSAARIAEEIEAVGGHLNAYTSRESTAYYARVLKEDVPLAVDILADILQNSTFDEDELARERAVVLQEIGQAHDTPDDVIFDHFQATAFPEQPMGRPVLGTAEIVGAMPRTALVDYLGEHYRAPRMVLVAAGAVDHDAIVTLAEAAFATLGTEADDGREPARYAGGDYREHRDLEQVHLLFGFKGISYDDPDYYAVSVLSTLFGGGMSSRLFQEVREKRGLVYSIYSFASSYLDDGLFGVYAGTGTDQLGELVPVICNEFSALTGSVGDDELHRARTQLRAGLMMARESTGARCEQLAQQLQVYGRPVPTEEIVEKIDAVDAAAITGLAERLISGRMVVAAVGPTDGLESYDAIAHRLGH